MKDDKNVPKRPAGVELSEDAHQKISMYPLDVGTVLEAALRVPPPSKPRRKGRQKKQEPPKEWGRVLVP